MKRWPGAVVALMVALVAVGAPAVAGEASRIRDNSFLIEEAYNQEPGVIQHITSFSRSFDSRDWGLCYVEEWPLRGLSHQISLSLSALHRDGTAEFARPGDVLVNYRYQAVGGGAGRVAFAPRLSLVLPAGDERRGYGAGGVGLEANLPLSLELGPRLAAHWNAGARLTPSARDTLGSKARTVAVSLGASAIFDLSPNLGLMLETVWARGEKVVGPDAVAAEQTLYVSPGVRWAFNLKSGLQIVPGVAVPLGVGPSAGDHGLFAYLSFEHPR